MLFPHLVGMAVKRAFVTGRSVWVQASTRGRRAACPACGGLSARVHSRYQRRLCDSAMGGQDTVIQLSVRRFFCPGTVCKKATFTEQVPRLAARYWAHETRASTLRVKASFNRTYDRAMRTCIKLSRNFGRWPTRLLTADLQRRLLRCRVPQKIILALVDQPVPRGTEWSFLRSR